jgi:tetratricopeptide (TPR) repeat protein
VATTGTTAAGEGSQPSVAAAASGLTSAVVAAVGGKKKVLWGGVVAAVVLLAAGVGFLFTHRAKALTEKDSILLTEFVNTTGDAVFDGTLKQALAVQLQQSPYLNVVPESRIQEALKYMGKAPTERITADIGREICQREGIKAMMTGSIAGLGSHYVITLNAVNAQSGDTMATQQVEAESKEQVLKALDKGASSLREKLGESLASVKQYAKPLEQATTSSLEALKEYSLGQAAHDLQDDIAAIPHLKKAVELDPNFARAYAVLGVCYGNNGDSKLSRENLAKAFALKDRGTEPERLYIEAHYYDTGESDVDRSIETYKAWIKTYPRETIPLDNLSLMYLFTGECEPVVPLAKQAIEINAQDNYAWGWLTTAYFCMNRLDEAKAVGEEAWSKNVRGTTAFRLMDIAAMRNDQATIDRIAAGVKGTDDELALRTWLGDRAAPRKMAAVRPILCRSKAHGRERGNP